METPTKPDPKSPPPHESEDADPQTAPETSNAEPTVPKPDPVRYGDWTVKGIAVDF